MHIVIDARNRRSSTGRYTDRLITWLSKIDTDNRYTILVEPSDDWKFSSPNFITAACPYQQFSFNPLDQIRFARQIYKLQPDLVHFTMTQQPLLYFGSIVTTTHDLTMLRHMRPSRFPAWIHRIGMMLYRFLFWWAHKKSKKIIVPTDFVKNDLAAYQPFTAAKIVRTYESAEPAKSGKSEPVKGVSRPFIFHVGQPLPHKNIQRLIHAFEQLKTTYSELLLVLPGKIKGVFKEDLDDWISQSPVKDSIIVPGFISDEQLRWLYEHAECYVLPSLSEGFGLPGLEAMVYSCPLVSSNATCMPEVYGDAAVYFDPYDVSDMTKAINSVIGNAALKKDLVAKGALVASQYSWGTMARETLNIYNTTKK